MITVGFTGELKKKKVFHLSETSYDRFHLAFRCVDGFVGIGQYRKEMARKTVELFRCAALRAICCLVTSTRPCVFFRFVPNY